jgi:hypothetical protein
MGPFAVEIVAGNLDGAAGDRRINLVAGIWKPLRWPLQILAWTTQIVRERCRRSGRRSGRAVRQHDRLDVAW